MRAIAAVCVVLVVAACGGAAPESEAGSSSGDWSPDSRYDGLAVEASMLNQVPSMVLTDTSGNDFNISADTEGKVRLIYQMFTNCPDICGIQLAQLASVLRRPGAPTNVQVVAVTVDPDRDTPELLRAYLDQFDESFVGLIPESESQLTDLQNALGSLASIRVIEDSSTTTTASGLGSGNGSNGSGDQGDEPHAVAGHETSYEIAHDARVFAYAPNGYGYVQYPYPTRQTQFEHDLPILSAIAPDAPPAAGL